SLILPSEEVNADDTADKEPSPSTQVPDTQHAKGTMAIVDATQSLEASVLVEEQGNQPKTADATKAHPRPNKESESALYSKSSVHSESVPRK
ncbi:hypothetical protein Tco_0120602, partial [Tanacetum coccineum]